MSQVGQVRYRGWAAGPKGTLAGRSGFNRRSADAGASHPVSGRFRLQREVVLWVFQVAFAALVAMTATTVAAQFTPGGDVFRHAWVRFVSCLALTTVLRLVYMQPTFERLAPGPRWLVIVGLCLGGAALEHPLAAVLGGGGPFSTAEDTVLRGVFPTRAAILMVWSLMFLSFQDRDRRRDLLLDLATAEAAARTSELKLLQTQMNPHFLFNALNSVIASRDDPAAVEELTEGLAGYLRFTLDGADLLEPLGRELEVLEHYLTVERARFGDALDCRIICDRAARQVMVPPMIIQPLLENALKHGGRASHDRLTIEVSARVADDMLTITVANSGNWVAPGAVPKSDDAALGNLRRRLELLGLPGAGVETTAADGWVRAIVTIPTVAAAAFGRQVAITRSLTSD